MYSQSVSVRESIELYRDREHVDLIAVLRPIIVLGIGKAVDLVKYYWVEEQQERTLRTVSTGMAKLISNTFDGLHEIQINNLQAGQLERLKGMIDEELDSSFSVGSTVSRLWQAISSRSLLDYVSEVYVVHRVLQKRGMTHQQYKKVQNDIDHVVYVVALSGESAHRCSLLVRSRGARWVSCRWRSASLIGRVASYMC